MMHFCDTCGKEKPDTDYPYTGRDHHKRDFRMCRKCRKHVTQRIKNNKRRVANINRGEIKRRPEITGGYDTPGHKAEIAAMEMALEMGDYKDMTLDQLARDKAADDQWCAHLERISKEAGRKKKTPEGDTLGIV